MQRDPACIEVYGALVIRIVLVRWGGTFCVIGERQTRNAQWVWEGGFSNRLPHYSQDFSLVCEAVERLQALNLVINLEVGILSLNCGYCCAAGLMCGMVIVQPAVGLENIQDVTAETVQVRSIDNVLKVKITVFIQLLAQGGGTIEQVITGYQGFEISHGLLQLDSAG
jgi:hypothetical protein